MGDAEAIESLYRRHAEALGALAYRITGSAPDAEEVVQDVFIGLTRALRRYEERGALPAWLRTRTARIAIDYRRRVARRGEVGPSREPLSSAESSALERIELEDALNRLPERLRAVFVLRTIEGFSHREIAGLLGIGTRASEVRQFRAIRKLRELLEDAT